MSKTIKPECKMTFEEALEKVEQTVFRMEQKDIPLEDLIVQYEEGLKLIEHCQQKLVKAQEKIELLTKAADGKVTLSTLADAEQVTEEKPAQSPSLF